MNNLIPRHSEDSEESWISVSDIMAGLMMVFLFIAVIYARDANQRANNVQEIVTEWQDSEFEIYTVLFREFRDDLYEWNAVIDKDTLTIRFEAPEVLFQRGEDILTPRFEEILTDFMPRYIGLLSSRFDDEIDEVRIEGHTSSEWFTSLDNKTDAFIQNMRLSQARTRTVLEYSLGLSELQAYTPWMIKKVSANGLSSAKLVIIDGQEDDQRSRRVEFTIKTKTKEALFRVLDKVAPAIEERI